MNQLATVRDRAPEAARRLVQTVADNPGQCAVLAAGGYVAAAVAVRAMRPRGLLDLLALAIVLDAAAGWAAGELLGRGIITLRIRDELAFCGPDCPGHTTGKPGRSCLGAAAGDHPAV